MTRQFCAVAAFLLSVAPGLAGAATLDDDTLLSFVEGDYALVGREPDGGAPYGGTARIERHDATLLLHEKRGARTIAATGRIETPSPPGEGRVLRFRWRDPEPMLMSCLVSGDLDNYARLTCTWLQEGTHPAAPGLEALFPTAAWERDSESGKDQNSEE
jgi:hypothetical protein